MKSLFPASRRHDIAFFASGRIDISAHLARRLSLAPADIIDISRDGPELYISVRLRAGQYSGRPHGRVWSTAAGRGTFRTWSRAAAAAVIDAAGIPDRSVLRCSCGEAIDRDDRIFITVIYRHPL